MSANNDYFVKFDSNALAWAEQIGKQLEPVRKQVVSLQRALYGLDKKAGEVSGKANGLFKPPPGRSPGSDPATRKVDSQALIDAKRAEAQMVNEVVHELQQAVLAIKKVPAEIKKSAKAAAREAIKQERGEGKEYLPGEGKLVKAGTPGAVKHGSPEHQFIQAIKKAQSAGDLSARAVTGGAKVGTFGRSSIATIQRSDINKANFDRVVQAINKQTGVLKSGLKVRGKEPISNDVSNTAATPPTKGKAKATPKAEQQLSKVEQELAEAQKELVEYSTLLAAVVKKAGDSLDASGKEALAKLQAAESKTKARIAKLEREASGKSRQDQKAERKAGAKAADAGKENITDTQLQERQRRQMLVNSALAPDFVAQAGKRGQNGLSKAQLEEMASTLAHQGFPVPRSGNKTKLATNIQQAARAHAAAYPEGDPSLSTKNVKVSKATKIADETLQILGDLDGAVKAREEAFKLTSPAMKSGDAGRQPNKGRWPHGATALGSELPPGTAKGAGGTPEQLKAAFGLIGKSNPESQMARVMAMATKNPLFNPFSAKHNIQVGSSPEEKTRGQAARAILSDVRLATSAIDKVTDRFDLLDKAISQSAAFIQRAQDRIEKGTQKPTDVEDIKAAQQNITANRKERADLLKQNPDINNPTYRQGYAHRLDAGANGVLRSDRQRFESMQAAQQGISPHTWWNPNLNRGRGGPEHLAPVNLTRGGTLSDQQLLRSSVIGTAMARPVTPDAAKQARHIVPGLGTMNDPNHGQVFTSKNGLSRDNQERLSKATAKYTRALEAQLRAVKSGDAEALAKAEHVLENRMNKLANAMADMFGGLSVPFQSFTGFAPRTEKVQADEARRQAVRDAAEQDRVRKSNKSTASPAQAAATADLALANATERLRKARIAEEAAAKKAAAAEQKVGQGLDPKERNARLAQWESAHRDSVKAGGEVNVLEERLRMTRAGGNPGMINGLHLEDKRAYDSNLYDAKLGYGPVLEDELARAKGAHAQANDRKAQAAKGLGDVDSLNKAVGAHTIAATKVEKYRKELIAAEAAATKTAEATKKDTAAKKQETTAVEKQVADSNGRIAQIKKEQAALRADGQYQRKDLKAAFAKGGVESEDYKAIKERRSQLSALRGELNGLTGGGKGGKGGGGDSTATGGGDFGKGSAGILRQILTELRSVHGTIKSGEAKGAGKVPTASASGTPATTTSSTPAATARTAAPPKKVIDAERAAALDAQRASSLETRRASTLRNQTRTENALAEVQRSRTRVSDQQARAAREQAVAEAALVHTIENLPPKIRAEVEALRALMAVEKDETKLVERRIAVYSLLARSMSSMGALNRTAKTTMGVNGNELAGIRQAAEAKNGFSGFGEESAGEFQSGFAKRFSGKGFWDRIVNTTGTFIVRNFAAGFVFGLTNALQEITKQALETEATFKRVGSALDAVGKEKGNIRGGLLDISTGYGVSLNDVYETAAQLVPVFKDVNASIAATRVSTQLQVISHGALNAQEAIGVLTSTYSAFSDELGQTPNVSGVEKIADVFTSIQNHIGINVEQTAEGVARISGLAHTMRMTLEESSVFTAQIAKQTNQTGAGAGEQFSRILNNLQTGRGKSAVNKSFGTKVFAQATDQNGITHYGQVISGMIKHWDELTEAQKRNVSTTVAGARQAAAFNALMNGGQSLLDALTEAQNSYGEASKRTDQILHTLQNNIKRVGANFQGLADELLRSGILDFAGLMLVSFNKVLGAVTKLLDAVNNFGDNNKLAGALRTMAGFAAGAYISIRLLVSSLRGLGGALAKARGTEVAANAAGETVASRSALGGAARHRAVPVEPVPVTGPFRRTRGIATTTGAAGRAVWATPSNLIAPNSGRHVAIPDEPGRHADRRPNLLTRAGDARIANRTALEQATEIEAKASARAAAAANQEATALSRAAAAADAAAKADVAHAAAMTQRDAAATEFVAAQTMAAERDVVASRQRVAAAEIQLKSAELESRMTGGTFRSRRAVAVAGEELAAAEQELAFATSEAARITARRIAAEERLIMAETEAYATNKVAGSAGFAARGAGAAAAGATQAASAAALQAEAASIEAASVRAAGGATMFSQTLSKSGAALTRTGQVASKTLGGITAGIGALASSAMATNVVLGGLAVAAVSFFSERSYDKSYAEGAHNYFDNWGKEMSAAAADAPKKYSGPAAKSFYEKFDAQNEKANGDFVDRTQAGAGFFMRNPVAGAKTFEAMALQMSHINDIGKLVGFDASDKLLTGSAKEYAKETGRDTKTGIQMGRPEFRDILGSKIQRGASQADSVEEVEDWYKQFKDASDAQMKAFQKRHDLSVQQKEGAAAAQADAQAEAAALVAARRAILEGSKSLDLLTNDQIQAIQTIGTAFTGLKTSVGGVDASKYATTILQGYGLDNIGPELEKEISKLTHGTNIQRAQANYQLQTDTLVDAQERLNEAMGKGGDDASEVTSATQALTTALQAQQAAWQAVFDAIGQTTDLMGQAQFNQGDFTGAAATFNKGLGQQQDMLNKNYRDRIAAANQQYGPQTTGITNDRTLGGLVAGTAPAAKNPKMLASETAAAQQELIAGQAQLQQRLQQSYQNEVFRQTKPLQEAIAKATDSVTRNALTQTKAAIELGIIESIMHAKPGQAVGDLSPRVVKMLKNFGIVGVQQEIAGQQAVSSSAETQRADANALRQSQAQVVQARIGVAEAYAQARGQTVKAAKIQVRLAQAQLSAARGDLAAAHTQAERNAALAAIYQAQAAIIGAKAGVRDARLQDDLDTIDFNLQMGKITQSSAVNALRNILKTHNLTKQQRRQLLLQIKGMQDQMKDTQWNFGDIKLPTPYQMKRFVAEKRNQFAAGADAAASAGASLSNGAMGQWPASWSRATATTTNNNNGGSTTIYIDGADTAKVEKIIKDRVGSSSSVRVRTTGARRG